MPILDGLTRLCRAPGGERILATLHRLAPAWLAQLPSLLTAEERLRIQGEMQGVTQQRMLREMAEALEALSSETPLILLLEDLHWSDYSTLDLLGTIARRSEPARLLILGTYRPVEMLAGDHPLRALKAELELHQQCEELRLNC
jgi:predicted ATPase